MQTIHEYQGFPANIRELTKVFNLVEQDSKSLYEESGLNYSKVRGLKDYLADFGLINSPSSLSEFGKIIRRNDKKLAENFSKWVCTYHWSVKANNPVLYYLINEFQSGDKRAEIADSFKDWASKNSIKTDYEKSYVSGLISKTINAFTDPDAFQILNFFTLHDDRLYRAEPYNVHPLLIAYILYDNQNSRVSTSVNELMQEPGNIGKFFGYDSRKLDKQLAALQDAGLIKRVQTADLNMINYLFTGTPLSLIERYYNENL